MHLSIIPPQHSLPLVSPLEQRGCGWVGAGAGVGGPEKQGNRTAVILKSASAHLSPLILFCNHVLAVVSSARSCSPALWGAAVLKESRVTTHARTRVIIYIV